MTRFFVLAQSFEHARYWADHNRLRREEWVFYSRNNQLDGYYEPMVVTYHSAWGASNTAELYDMAHARRAQFVNPVTGEIRT